MKLTYLALLFIVGIFMGMLIGDVLTMYIPLQHCTLIKGEKGINGGGDGGDGLFCRNGFVILPGKAGK